MKAFTLFPAAESFTRARMYLDILYAVCPKSQKVLFLNAFDEAVAYVSLLACDHATLLQ